MGDKGAVQEIDRSELELVYRRYGTLVWRRARKILADDQLAWDVCQEVFIRLLRTGRTWDTPSPVGWLFRVTTHCCLNLIRGSRRWRDFLRFLPAPSAVVPSLSAQMVLRGIPVRLQEIALYYGLDCMTQQEIALVLGLSQKTVSNRIRELRSWLADEETQIRVKQT
jgi:RNA polymerase sigma-70 factor, ECF subfamily